MWTNAEEDFLRKLVDECSNIEDLYAKFSERFFLKDIQRTKHAIVHKMKRLSIFFSNPNHKIPIGTWSDAEVERLEELEHGCVDWEDLYAQFGQKCSGHHRTIIAVRQKMLTLNISPIFKSEVNKMSLNGKMSLNELISEFSSYNGEEEYNDQFIVAANRYITYSDAFEYVTNSLLKLPMNEILKGDIGLMKFLHQPLGKILPDESFTGVVADVLLSNHGSAKLGVGFEEDSTVRLTKMVKTTSSIEDKEAFQEYDAAAINGIMPPSYRYADALQTIECAVLVLFLLNQKYMDSTSTCMFNLIKQCLNIINKYDLLSQSCTPMKELYQIFWKDFGVTGNQVKNDGAAAATTTTTTTATTATTTTTTTATTTTTTAATTAAAAAATTAAITTAAAAAAAGAAGAAGAADDPFDIFVPSKRSLLLAAGNVSPYSSRDNRNDKQYHIWEIAVDDHMYVMNAAIAGAEIALFIKNKEKFEGHRLFNNMILIDLESSSTPPGILILEDKIEIAYFNKLKNVISPYLKRGGSIQAQAAGFECRWLTRYIIEDTSMLNDKFLTEYSLKQIKEVLEADKDAGTLYNNLKEHIELYGQINMLKFNHLLKEISLNLHSDIFPYTIKHRELLSKKLNNILDGLISDTPPLKKKK